MKQWRSIILLGTGLLMATQAIAVDPPTVICNQDNYNATRYVGGRNIARTPAGDAAVVFEPGQLYTNQDIWGVVWDAETQNWSAPMQISNAQATHTGTPALAADEEGRIHAYWKELNLEGDRDAMYSFWQDGTWSTPVVADNLSNNAGVGTIEVASDGSLFNAFSIWGVGTNYDANIYAGHSTDGGATWQTTNLTSTFPTPDVLPLSFLDVSLAAGNDGRMYAAWEDEPYGSSYECMLAEYDGSNWLTPEVVSSADDSLGALRYVDACTPADGAIPVYLMGPEGYSLAGQAASIYNESGSARTLSSFYNPRYITPDWTRDELVGDVVTYFNPTSILVVDDDNRYNHETYLYEALTNNGIAFDSLDTDADGDFYPQSPDASILASYDLVIWFCGDDGGNNAFWEDGDVYEIDNPDVISYLDGGGDLWVIGLDWIYDRYAGAPDSFNQGDFMLDYLGIASYDAQAYADDGGVGVFQLDLAPGHSITDVDSLNWGVGGIRQGEPSIATDSAGDLHMVYVQSGGIWHIEKQDGSWTIPVRVDNSADTMSTMRPNISIDDQDGIYVTWKEETGNNPLIYNVMYSTSIDGGLTWAIPVQLSESTTASLSGYSVMRPTMGSTIRPPMDGVFAGGADVVWTQWNAQSTLGYDIMYGRIPYLWVNPVDDLSITIDSGDVLLSWSPVSGATSYRIYTDTEPFGDYANFLGEVSTPGYTHTGAANGSLFYRVVVVR